MPWKFAEKSRKFRLKRNFSEKPRKAKKFVEIRLHYFCTILYIDSHLNYNEHITKTVSDCIHKLTRVNRIKHLLDQKTLIFLINAFIFSKLFYCSTVWSNTSKENVGKLQSVQNYACRIVAGLRKFDHISGALKSLKWLSVKDKLLFNDLVMVSGFIWRKWSYAIGGNIVMKKHE